MAKIHLAPFDPARAFVALRPFMCKGEQFDRGDKFKRQLVTTRTLKIFYECRAIGYSTDHRGIKPFPGMKAKRAPTPAAPVQIEKDELAVASRPVLAAMARRAGIRVQRSFSRADLIDQLTRVPNVAAHG